MSDFCLFGVSLEDEPETISPESKGKKRKREEDEHLHNESDTPISKEKFNQLESSLLEKCKEIQRKIEENEVLKSSLDFSERSLKKVEDDVRAFKQKNDDLEKLLRILKRDFASKAAQNDEKVNNADNKYQTLEDQYKDIKGKNAELTKKLQELENTYSIKKEVVNDVKKENKLKELTKKIKDDESKYKKLEEENKIVSQNYSELTKKLKTLEEQLKILKEQDPKKFETLTTEYEAKLVRKNEAIRKLISRSKIKTIRIQKLQNILRRLWRTLEGVSAVSSSSSLDLVKLIQTQILIEVHPLDPALNIMSPDEPLSSSHEDLEVTQSPNETVPSQSSTQIPGKPNTEILKPQPTLASPSSNPFSWDLRSFFSPQEFPQPQKEQDKVNQSVTSPDPPTLPSQTTTMNITLPPKEHNNNPTNNQENGNYFNESIIENIIKLCFGVTCEDVQKQLASYSSPQVPESSQTSLIQHTPYNSHSPPQSHTPTSSLTTSLVSPSHKTHSASLTTLASPPPKTNNNTHSASHTTSLISPPHNTHSSSLTTSLVTTPSSTTHRNQSSPTTKSLGTTTSRNRRHSRQRRSSSSQRESSHPRVSYNHKSPPTYYHDQRSPKHSYYYQANIRNPPDYYQAPGPHQPSYNREVCSYWKKGCCPRGDACHMIHSAH